MANLSAALNSLASTTVVDVFRSRIPERRLLWIGRIATVVWGVVLVLIGVVASHWGSVLESGLSIASVTLGVLLGVFLLGTLTRKPDQRDAIIGVIFGTAVILYVKFQTTIAFTWWVLIGSAATFAAGLLASLILGKRRTAHG